MRLAALFSGGKDSVFSAYLAEESGHEIAYLVNIISKTGDSWMFHTPNQNCVPFMAESMSVPLKTAESDGSEEGDLKALAEALGKLDIDGVVTGAVWSDYQWERINAICGDLGLFVYSPLWRKNQETVYDEMVSSGVEAIIVGTFAEGLDSSWLGKKLDSETKKDLITVNEKHGVSILGEGGEYESLTLDSPLFSRKLVLEKFSKEEKSSSSVIRVEKCGLL